MSLAFLRRTYVKLALSVVIYGALLYTIHHKVFVNRGILSTNDFLQYTTLVNSSEVTSSSTATTEPGSMVLDDRMDEIVKPWAGDPTMVVIQSYQRCGSTFFGDMFNNNPDVFYQFEPLDALYSHIYGTEFGWNVPSDIYYHGNGTRRPISMEDTALAAEHLRTLLSCDTGRLPTDTLVHSYQLGIQDQFLSTRKYIKCMKEKVQPNTKRRPKCTRTYLANYCGKRYGMTSDSRRETCRELSSNPRHINTTEAVPNPVRRAFQTHHRCLTELRDTLDSSCTETLKSTCNNKPIRAAKLVRANMRSMEKLLESQPNLYVIHLLRDPRGVALSRINLHDSVRGHFSNVARRNKDEMIAREALLYCSVAVEDVLARQELEKRFPERILTVIYDDFVTDVADYVNIVYDFINRTLDDETYEIILARMTENTDKRKKQVNTIRLPSKTHRRLRKFRYAKNPHFISTTTPSSADGGSTLPPSVDIGTRWQKKLSKEVSERIMRECRQFYDNVKFDWNV